MEYRIFSAAQPPRAGGVYLWKSREDADALYTDRWKQLIRDQYGSDPVISYFESPVIVDNQYGETHIG